MRTKSSLGKVNGDAGQQEGQELSGTLQDTASAG